MNATALVIAACEQKRSQIVQQLSATQLFARVEPLASGTGLFHHLKSYAPDLICWGLGKEEKATWIAKLSGTEEWHDLPLIAFADNQKSMLSGFSLGASDAVILPITADELGARLKGHLKRWQRLSELRQSKEQLQKMALTDPLTGLGNRATFDMSIKQASARAQRSATPYSLLMIDLDHFKWFNDSYGHQAGDNVLQLVAGAIRASARDADICCRFGGEEFAVILPDTEAKNAQILAERIHKQIARVSRNPNQQHRPVTVSIGISSAGQKGSLQPRHVIEEADRALYLAKENGRNRTEIWRPSSTYRRLEYSFSSAAQHLAFGT